MEIFDTFRQILRKFREKLKFIIALPRPAPTSHHVTLLLWLLLLHVTPFHTFALSPSPLVPKIVSVAVLPFLPVNLQVIFTGKFTIFTGKIYR